MSTVPGEQSWRDAGLVEPGPTDLPEIATEDDDGDGRDDGYRPEDPRPDLADEADPADVAEQSTPVPGDEREDYP
jgi:hypothetical protein